MGLERVAAVRDALRLVPAFPVFTVGGTNGKGSACAMLEAILAHAGYKVGCYTSPHLVRYNERVRIAGVEADEAQLVRAFSRIEEARCGVPLTYFEFGTLAAVWLFAHERVDVSILEVGLGGRLDAVNAFDADCALVMSVGLDHMEYLGPTREEIGYEKAGIFRAGRPAICGDPEPPQSLRRHAAAIGARLLVQGAQFGYSSTATQWQYWGPHGRKSALPHPALRGRHQLRNAAACIAALDEMRERLPVTMADIRGGLAQASIPGRFQVLPGRPMVILDVAHNPHAAAVLAENLAQMGRTGRTFAVFSMLRDKDIAGVIAAVRQRIDHWFVAGIDSPRGAGVDELARILSEQVTEEAITRCGSIAEAYAQACDRVSENDKILVFGSFHTVGAVIEARRLRASLRP
jgi:dihydrofolate synthase/folylpolyglutamate synthase